ARDRGLVDSKEYLDVLARTRFPDSRPAHVTWFVKPFVEPKSAGRSADLKDLGFSGVIGIGGATRLGGDPLAMHSRIFIHAPKPERAMKMLNFPNEPALAPADWVPADVAGCQTFQWDMRDVLSSIGLMFDRVTGKEGDFRAIVRALKEDPDGPKVDLQRDIIDRLSGRVTLIADCAEPVPERGGRALIAFQTRDQKALSSAVAELVRGEERVTSRTVAGNKILEIPLPARNAKDGHAISTVLAVAVTQAHLFVANDSALLESVLAKNSTGALLTRQPDYQKV